MAQFKNYIPNVPNVDVNSYLNIRRDVDSKMKQAIQVANSEVCAAAIRKWVILNGYNMRNIRTNINQVEKRCDGSGKWKLYGSCKWKLYSSLDRKRNSFTIKTPNSGHMCNRKMENRQALYGWISTKYLHKLRRNPNMTAALLIDDVMEKYCVQISISKAYRAKGHALELLRGSVIEHYIGLRSYKTELMRVDLDGRFDFVLGNETTFKGFYMGFSGLRKGFLKGCKPIIGFDGCFLKTFLGGALLSAIAKDGNNQMFPICWAVVESENEEYWMWFLKHLFDDLGIIDGNGWSFISDQQKGLINAISKLAPHAEHRNCACISIATGRRTLRVKR
ncbi:uncharacterized protein LOC126672633 [Mercurialis annua]|uniref:uncharacterized protein LOC126672633 n=1 Tax=Mercurialis annua TaxID=3986 RepID=UPI002160AF61|nr:uncharacterized protein LOC126672633 [Mercurialis annua]